jgi:hypothetical protein
MADSRRITRRAAEKGRQELAARAPLLLRIVDRQVLGVRRNELMERLALAQVQVVTERHEAGKMRMAREIVTEIDDNRAQYIDGKIADAVATSDSEINVSASAAYVVARDAMLAMGLSTARSDTLTAILQTMRDTAKASAKASASTAATSAAMDGSRRVLTRVSNQLEEIQGELKARVDKVAAAVAEELARARGV